MTVEPEQTQTDEHTMLNETPGERRFAWAGFLLAFLWVTYSLNGFRSPTTPIVLSDLDAGSLLRQVIFGGSAMVSIILLIGTGQLWTVLKRDIYWWIFGLLLICSSLYSDSPSLTIKRSVLYICGLLTAGLIVSALGSSIQHVIVLIGTLCSIVAAVSLVWWGILPAEITTNPGRGGLAGISNHPNTLAPAMTIGVIVLSTLLTETRRGMIARLIGLSLCLTALILTWSITSYIMCFVGVGAAMLTLWGGYLRGLIAVVLAAAGGALMIMGKARVSDDLFAAFNRDSTMSGRDVLWEIVLEQIRQFPIFGHGWGAFWYEGRGRDLVGTWNPRQSHNAYFDVMLDVGIVGLTLFALALAVSLAGVFRCLHAYKNQGARRAAAGSLGVGIGLLSVYGLQQSFFGKPDSFAFAALLWICLSVHAQGKRCISVSGSTEV